MPRPQIMSPAVDINRALDERLQEFCERVYEARHAYGLTQAELSRLSGVSTAAISNIESRKCPGLKFGTALRLAITLDLSLDRMQEPE